MVDRWHSRTQLSSSSLVVLRKHGKSLFHNVWMYEAGEDDNWLDMNAAGDWESKVNGEI